MLYHHIWLVLFLFGWIFKLCQSFGIPLRDKLQFEAGDVIACNIKGTAAYHMLLATSSSTVAHIVVDKSERSGILKEETWPYDNRNCWKHSRATVIDAVKRARSDISGYGRRKIHYNVWTCNCEHWVDSWAAGGAFSHQTLRRPDSSCDVGKRTFGSGRNKATVTIYQHYDWNIGAKTILSVGQDECFSWAEDSWWNDRASQLILEEGSSCIRLWSDPNCKGHSVCFCESPWQLSNKMMAWGKSWNDQITSLSLCDYREEIKATVVLYEHYNFGGSKRKMKLQDKECVSFFNGDWWDDRVSSVKVEQGCVKYFISFSCKGTSFKLDREVSKLNEDFNDKISSVRPC